MLFLGLPAFIMMQTAWCCAMNKCGFITAGVLALVAAGIVLASAVVVLLALSAWDCDDDDFFDDDFSSSCEYDYDKSDATVWLSLSFISAILWVITGILVLVFACGKRHQDISDQLRAERAEGAAVPSATAVAEYPTDVKTAVPIAAAMPMQKAPV
jgi:hypothetical protein